MTSLHQVYPNTFAPYPSNVTELDTADWRWTQWLGADSTAMVRRPDGAILIFCGDTYTTTVPTGTAFTGGSFTNNSLLYALGGRFGVEYANGTGPFDSPGTNIFGSPNPYLPGILSPAGFRWGQGAFVDVGTDSKVHLMATEYSGNIFTSYAAVNLREYVINQDLTVSSSALVPGLAPQTLTSVSALVTWGHAVIVDYSTNYTYIFGTYNVPLDGYRVVVCRRNIAFGSLPGNTPDFWTGSTWSSSMQDVVALGPTPGNSLSVIQHPAGGWLMTSCRKGLFDTNIAAWWSATPNGTWTDLGDIYTIPSEFTGQYNYGGLSYITDNNKLRLMYNLNGPVAQIQADYRRYGIRWVEVEIPKAVLPFSATGGTTTDSGGYRYHTFNSSGNFVVTGSKSMDILVVGGGGSGAGGNSDQFDGYGIIGGGGGGAGRFTTSTINITGGTYVVTVGGGGAASNHGGGGNTGTTSSFSATTAVGGGGGNDPSQGSMTGGTGGNSTFNGGGLTGFPSGGAGGGGTSSVGANASNENGSNGGAGSTWNSFKSFGGGGGGGGGGQVIDGGNPIYSTGGTGGTTGGGNGGYYNNSTNPPATSGTANTGGGGGGQNIMGTSFNGAGGSGVVIVRYLL